MENKKSYETLRKEQIHVPIVGYNDEIQNQAELNKKMLKLKLVPKNGYLDINKMPK